MRGVGVEPSQKLDVIRAVAANLTPAQVARLRTVPGLRVYADRQLRTSGSLLEPAEDHGEQHQLDRGERVRRADHHAAHDADGVQPAGDASAERGDEPGGRVAEQLGRA